MLEIPNLYVSTNFYCFLDSCLTLFPPKQSNQAEESKHLASNRVSKEAVVRIGVLCCKCVGVFVYVGQLIFQLLFGRLRAIPALEYRVKHSGLFCSLPISTHTPGM